jgi:hypothetical protein
VSRTRAESLENLHAAAVTVHVAETADIHEYVEAKPGPGVKGAQRFVMTAAMAQSELDDFVNARRGQRGNQISSLPVGVVAGRVEQRGRQFDFEGFGAFHQIHQRRLRNWSLRKQFRRHLAKCRLGLHPVRVGFGVLHQRGCGVDLAEEQIRGFRGQFRVSGEFFDESGSVSGIDIPCRACGGFAQFLAETAYLGNRVRKQARNLSFEGAGVDDLPERGVGGQRQQVAGDVEGTRLESALVGLGFHRLGAGDPFAKRIEHGGSGALIRGEKILGGLAVQLCGGGVRTKIREEPA